MTSPTSPSTHIDLGSTLDTIPLPVTVTHAIPPVDTVRLILLRGTAATSFSHVQNAAQGFVATLGVIGSTFTNLNASFIDVLSLAQSIASLGRASTATAGSVASADPAMDPPPTGQQPAIVLRTRNFIGILGLISGTAAVLLRMAVLSGAAATPTTNKDQWKLVQAFLLAVVILAVLAATGEAAGTFFVIHPHPTTRPVVWKKRVKIFARCLAVLSLFLLLAALGCMRLASISIGVTVG